jgi:hypothetical protein
MEYLLEQTLLCLLAVLNLVDDAWHLHVATLHLRDAMRDQVLAALAQRFAELLAVANEELLFVCSAFHARGRVLLVVILEFSLLGVPSSDDWSLENVFIAQFWRVQALEWSTGGHW